MLLGASASHDPDPPADLSRESMTSSNLGCEWPPHTATVIFSPMGFPTFRPGLTYRAGRRLAARDDAVVTKTLRARSLVEFWLQAALAAEGGSMPGWRGVVLAPARRLSPGRRKGMEFR